MRDRKGIGLVEILLATCVLAVVGGALLTSLQEASRQGVRAQGRQRAFLLGERVLAHQLLLGYENLLPAAGQRCDLDLSGLEARHAAGNRLVADGVEFGAAVEIEALRSGLLCVRIRMSHRVLASPGPAAEVTLVRFISDTVGGDR